LPTGVFCRWIVVVDDLAGAAFEAAAGVADPRPVASASDPPTTIIDMVRPRAGMRCSSS
jgi:hypothetical protein